MSDIYIPGVSLPTDGDFELWIAVKKDGSFTYNVRGGWNDGKQKAIAVPDHGRLGDLDALEKETFFSSYFNDKEKEIVRAFIVTTPTVIPADKEK